MKKNPAVPAPILFSRLPKALALALVLICIGLTKPALSQTATIEPELSSCAYFNREPYSYSRAKRSVREDAARSAVVDCLKLKQESSDAFELDIALSRAYEIFDTATSNEILRSASDRSRPRALYEFHKKARHLSSPELAGFGTFEFLLGLADAGFVPAARDVAIDYFVGGVYGKKLVQRNYSLAELYAERAIDPADPDSPILLAQILYRSPLKDKRSRAISLLNDAARNGSTSAHYALGKIYADSNFSKSVYHLSVAAEAGNKEANLALGEMFLRGTSMPIELARAKKYLCAAGLSGRTTYRRLMKADLRCATEGN